MWSQHDKNELRDKSNNTSEANDFHSNGSKWTTQSSETCESHVFDLFTLFSFYFVCILCRYFLAWVLPLPQHAKVEKQEQNVRRCTQCTVNISCLFIPKYLCSHGVHRTVVLQILYCAIVFDVIFSVAISVLRHSAHSPSLDWTHFWNLST